MKNLKKIMALMIAMVMVLGMSTSVFAEGDGDPIPVVDPVVTEAPTPAPHAANDSHTLTITPNNNVTAHSYEAYQIFKGVLEGNQADGVTEVTEHPYQVNLIQWGDNVVPTTLLNALRGDTSHFNYVAAAGNVEAHNDFTNCTDAADVAAVLATYDNDDANMRAFAAIVGDNTSGVLTGNPTQGTAAAGDSVRITGLADGYYFIKDLSNSQSGANGSYTRFVLQVVGDTEVTAKDILPSIDKEIVTGGNSGVDAKSASIGDEVSYKVTGIVPDMDGYESFVYQITDTMSKGLTFNEDEVVTVGDETLSRVYKAANGYFYASSDKAAQMIAGEPAGNQAVYKGYTIEKTVDETTGVTTITIYIVNFIQYNVKQEDDDTTPNVDESAATIVGKPVIVTYSATINEYALVEENNANAGNSNNAKLTYSNDPNHSGKGENGEPNPTNPTGEGTGQEVKVYTTGLEISKVDGQNRNKNLAGAAFKLTGEAVNVVIVKTEMYIKCSADDIADNLIDKYYMLKDGTYTTTVPNDTNRASYEDDTTQYKKISAVTKECNGSATNNAIGVTGNDGKLEFAGLGEGLYTLTETKAPTGYNLLTNPIYIYIKFTQGTGALANTGTFTVYRYKDSAAAPNVTSETDFNSEDWTVLSNGTGSAAIEYAMTVENNSGSTLPETGGIGTTIFYVVGSLLVIGAGILLITRKRMASH